MAKHYNNKNNRFNKKEKYIIQWLYDVEKISQLCVSVDMIDAICGDLFHSFNHRDIVAKMYFGIKDGNITCSKYGRIQVNGNITIGNDRNKTKKKQRFVSKIKYTKRFTGEKFYSSKEWRELRVEAFTRYGRKCCLCGRGVEHGIVLHVDHIKPRSKRHDLELDINNLQILCEDCNLGKSNKYSEDWRVKDNSIVTDLYKD